VPDLIGGKPGVDGNHDRPQRRDGAEQREEFKTVPGQNGDPVSPANPAGSQCADDGMCLVIELSERDPALFGLYRRPLFEYARVPFEYVVHGETAKVHVPLPYPSVWHGITLSKTSEKTNRQIR
jgi:hypothetical protein